MTQLTIDDLLRQQDRKAARLSGEHTTPKVHDFHESLKRGENARLHAFLDEAYQKHFPTVQKIERFTDMQQQRSGRDTRVTLQGGEIIHVQEKSRDRDDDRDIALEFEHKGQRYNAPGWVDLDLQIHYLAYAFVPLRKVYFFPWPQLRRAWIEHGEDWKSLCPVIGSLNDGYTTYCVCVPVTILFKAIVEASVIQL
jgi:hypothetical protein